MGRIHANLKTFKAADKPRSYHVTEAKKTSPANPGPLHSQAERRRSRLNHSGCGWARKMESCYNAKGLAQRREHRWAMSMKRSEQANPRRQKAEEWGWVGRLVLTEMALSFRWWKCSKITWWLYNFVNTKKKNPQNCITLKGWLFRHRKQSCYQRGGVAERDKLGAWD